MPRNLRRGSLQPFDRRFSGRFLTASPRAASPTISASIQPSPSRQSSLASTTINEQGGSETPQPPWDVVRWTKLKKISGLLFSETGRRNYGRPTVMAVGASIVIGTSKGLVLVFDYHQVLVATIGLGTAAVESGSTTSLAISADHTTVAAGHATGHVFTWELGRPARPFLHISPIPGNQIASRSSDGHVAGSAVVHVGFLGTRHTALVSADDRGMAFSHLATRGLGAVARTVKTVRMLGRYPVPAASIEKQRRASSVLAFASLPLGNVEHPTDGLGLTALLTPYLLVIVSTTPVAETQFKIPRPKEIPPHSTLSGCLAWFPAVRLKQSGESQRDSISRTKLVYCWSHVLTILDVESQAAEEKDKPPLLHFHPRSRWRCQEPIVAVQWLSRSVIGILTISQQLMILEDGALRVTDSFDLVQKYINHRDIFSTQLQHAVESLQDDNDSLHGVVADAFYMSFRSYKGRLFLLGFNDVSVGTLSNWADRLAALLEAGKYIEAIHLAEVFYAGTAERITVGLPEDDAARHALVQGKVVEILTASLKYVFSARGDDDQGFMELVDKLASSSFSVCLAMDDTDLLFEDVFRAFDEAALQQVFFKHLEPYILSNQINAVPTVVFKAFAEQYNTNESAKQLENIICRLDVRMMDIDQTASICKRFQLYDALIYVWNQSIDEYVTPLIELLSLIKDIIARGEEQEFDPRLANASKILHYLAHVFSGHSYPNGDELNEGVAFRAKADLYTYLFSLDLMSWPPGSKSVFHASDEPDDDMEYPYLSLILQFDAPNFLSMLNEAFEDQFLNTPTGDEDDRSKTLLTGDIHTELPSRQSIITILLDVMTDDGFGSEDCIFLDMFIARNLPKFPQFIVLPGSVLEKVLVRLCDFPLKELADDCQLSVEYLLSHYQPSDILRFTPIFRTAGFFRVLKTMYRNSRLYSELVETCFEDPLDQEAVFETIGDCLRAGSDLTQKQTRDVRSVILQHAQQLVDINSKRAAQTIYAVAPELLEPIFEKLDEDSLSRFTFLKSLLEGIESESSSWGKTLHERFDEAYVLLMCAYEPAHVAGYINLLKTGDLRLQEVLPAIEKSGAIDAAVTLLLRDGLITDAMNRLKSHMQTLGSALIGLVSASSHSPDVSNTAEGVEDILDDVQRYSKVGVWLCQGQTKLRTLDQPGYNPKNGLLSSFSLETDLTLDEFLWLELIDTVVSITQKMSATGMDLDVPANFDVTMIKITSSLKNAVQDCFSALLSSTARPTLPKQVIAAPDSQPHPSFLVILKAFLLRAASSTPSLSNLRLVLSEIFQAYAFEERILHLANHFLDKDIFEHVQDAWSRRQTGWRPRGNVCELCDQRLWGPGVGGGIWEQWEAQTSKEHQKTLDHHGYALNDRASEEVGIQGRGKGKAQPSVPDEHLQELTSPSSNTSRASETSQVKGDPARTIVVFSCRHLWHKDCLERTIEAQALSEADEGLRCPAHHT